MRQFIIILKKVYHFFLFLSRNLKNFSFFSLLFGTLNKSFLLFLKQSTKEEERTCAPLDCCSAFLFVLEIFCQIFAVDDLFHQVALGVEIVVR